MNWKRATYYYRALYKSVWKAKCEEARKNKELRKLLDKVLEPTGTRVITDFKTIKSYDKYDLF